MSSIVSKVIKERNLKFNVNVPKVDSVFDIKIKVTKADVSIAKKVDPTCCALARAARRVFENVAETWVFKSAAWLHVINEDGSEQYIRFIPGTEARKAIEQFDKNGSFPSGEYLLLAPKGTQTLKEIETRSAKRKGRHKPGDGKIRRKPRINSRVNWSGA